MTQGRTRKRIVTALIVLALVAALGAAIALRATRRAAHDGAAGPPVALQFAFNDVA